jgi:hypothetical protein
MVTGIEPLCQFLRMLRVCNQIVKVDDRIEMSWSPNPFIHSLAVCFARCIRMIIIRPDEWRNRPAYHLQRMSVYTLNDLRISTSYSLYEIPMLFRRCSAHPRQSTEIVDAFQHQHVTNATLLCGPVPARNAGPDIWRAPRTQ